ncbi:MAG: hypothetical protein C7B47_00435 [Sulfobacillus thermosulfidooxidans]|uniref:Glycosyl transferase family 1 domain-containing protein n=1 Tax=Sulfobacillus thermosulfidooxidans TaxID=28034 RepID=A0A2T2X5P4_SULTH|nr:MAG: hypothetical protein C7B47_00435 [Sulfobacillus thermosulfidooxidans]
MVNLAIVSRRLSGRGGMETVIKTVAQTAQADRLPLSLWAMGRLLDTQWLHNISYRDVNIDQGTGRRLQLRAKLPLYIMALTRLLKESDVDTLLVTDPTFVEAAHWARRIVRRPLRIFSWVHFSLDKLANTSSLRLADGHLAIYQGIKRQLAAIPVSAPIFVVHNPLPYDFHPIPPGSMAPGQLLYVGRLNNHQKRLDLLFEALAQITGPWQLNIMGDGPDSTWLKELTHQLGIDNRVHFNGWQANPWRLTNPRALVLTSDFEGFPMVLVEGLAHGIPVIATNCPTGPEDIVENHKNGLLVPTGSIPAIRDAIRIALDREWPWLLSPQEIQQDIISRFNASHVFRTMLNAINSVPLR